ncbi:hypothetical protein GGR56DRAFT_367805 [Xylariaceae sp. FL0804]|nr:hypothetical protein GGR56DRAFT_367805 [Xylariaceae sp. FL0804]
MASRFVAEEHQGEMRDVWGLFSKRQNVDNSARADMEDQSKQARDGQAPMVIDYIRVHQSPGIDRKDGRRMDSFEGYEIQEWEEKGKKATTTAAATTTTTNLRSPLGHSKRVRRRAGGPGHCDAVKGRNPRHGGPSDLTERRRCCSPAKLWRFRRAAESAHFARPMETPDVFADKRCGLDHLHAHAPRKECILVQGQTRGQTTMAAGRLGGSGGSPRLVLLSVALSVVLQMVFT